MTPLTALFLAALLGGAVALPPLRKAAGDDATSTAGVATRGFLNPLGGRSCTVTNQNDAGAGSFRDCIAEANMRPVGSKTTISFASNVAGKSILLSSTVNISNSVLVDGKGTQLVLNTTDPDTDLLQVKAASRTAKLNIELRDLTLREATEDLIELNQPGAYVLLSNVRFQDAIDVSGDNAIDLGDEAGDAEGVVLVLRHCDLMSMDDNAIEVPSDVGPIQDLTIKLEHTNIVDSSEAGILITSSTNITGTLAIHLLHSSIYDNDSQGIDIRSGSIQNLDLSLKHSRVNDNDSQGIRVVSDTIQKVQMSVLHSQIVDNDDEGILFGDESITNIENLQLSITDSHISNNDNEGISFESKNIENLQLSIKDSHISNNGLDEDEDGVFISGRTGPSTRVLLSRSVFQGNGDDGFDMSGPVVGGDIKVEHCLFKANDGDSIDLGEIFDDDDEDEGDGVTGGASISVLHTTFELSDDGIDLDNKGDFSLQVVDCDFIEIDDDALDVESTNTTLGKVTVLKSRFINPNDDAIDLEGTCPQDVYVADSKFFTSAQQGRTDSALELSEDCKDTRVVVERSVIEGFGAAINDLVSLPAQNNEIILNNVDMLRNRYGVRAVPGSHAATTRTSSSSAVSADNNDEDEHEHDDDDNKPVPTDDDDRDGGRRSLLAAADNTIITIKNSQIRQVVQAGIRLEGFARELTLVATTVGEGTDSALEIVGPDNVQHVVQSGLLSCLASVDRNNNTAAEISVPVRDTCGQLAPKNGRRP